VVGQVRISLLLIAWLPLAASSPHGSAARLQAPPPEPPPYDASAINSPDQPDIGLGAKGSGVLRAQILLDRAHFSCGQIDGEYGTNLEKTVAAFQRERNLPVTEVVNADTWAALNQDKAPVLASYAIDQEDVAGPFVKVPASMMAQAKLDYLGYSSPLEELGEKFHVKPELLAALNPGKDFTRVGDPITVPNANTLPPGQAAQVVVSKSDSSVTAFDAQGKLLAYYVATIGSEHDPLPIGDWKIDAILRNPVFHYNPDLFWDAKPGDQKAEIKAGPRNPVGLVWMNLSKEHYGIHGTPNPGKIGHTESHGCIRLTNWDAWQLADMIQPGTPAILKE